MIIIIVVWGVHKHKTHSWQWLGPLVSGRVALRHAQQLFTLQLRRGGEAAQAKNGSVGRWFLGWLRNRQGMRPGV